MDLKLGLVPVLDDEATRLATDQIAAALGSVTERTCAVHRAPSPASLSQAFGAGDVNLVWSSPTLSLSAPEMGESVPIVTCVRQGVAHYHGVLFVRQDSPIQTVNDLEGRSVAWVARTSAAGYIYARVALAARGLDANTLFSEERFLETHGAVVLSVLDGDVEVGATFAVFEDGDAQRPMVRAGFVDLGRESDARVVLSTLRIPSDLFVATPALHGELGDQLAAAIERVAAELPDPFHRVFGADDVVRSDPKGLGELRRQLGDARAMGVLDGR